MENETMWVKLHEMWYIATKRHLNWVKAPFLIMHLINVKAQVI